MKRRHPNVIVEFSDMRPEGDIIDGARDLIDEAEPRLDAGPDTKPLTLAEIGAQYRPKTSKA